MNKKEIINNVKCYKCNVWGWIGWFKKIEKNKYLCDECGRKK